jgi:hypothetical protein
MLARNRQPSNCAVRGARRLPRQRGCPDRFIATVVQSAWAAFVKSLHNYAQTRIGNPVRGAESDMPTQLQLALLCSHRGWLSRTNKHAQAEGLPIHTN